MREGLRSGSLRGKDHNVDSGHDASGLKTRNIPDLNVKEDPNVLSAGEGEKSCFTVSKNDGILNGSLCEKVGPTEAEFKGVEVEHEGEVSGSQSVKCTTDPVGERKEVEEGVEGLVGYAHGSFHECSRITIEVEKQIDDCSWTLGQDIDVCGEENEVGLDVPQLSSEAPEGADKFRSLEDDEKKMVCVSKEEEVKDENMESNAEIYAKYPQGVAMSVADCPDGVSPGNAGSVRVNNDNKNEMVGEHIDCVREVVDGDMQSNCGVVTGTREEMGGAEGSDCKFDADDNGEDLDMEAEQGRVQAGVKVLRSRVVLANVSGEEAGSGQIKAVDRKRKRGADGPREKVVTMEDESNKSAIDSERIRKRGRPRKSIDPSEVEVVGMKKSQAVSRAEDKDVSKSHKRSKKKGKRGRPRLSVGRREEEVVQKKKPEVVSQVREEDLCKKSVRKSKKKGKRGRPRKSVDFSEEEDVICDVEDETGKASNKSIRSSKLKRRRPVDCPQEVVQVKVSVSEVDDEDGSEDEDRSSKRVRNSKKKHKRGRPKLQEGNGAVNTIVHDKGKVKDDKKIKVSLAAAPVRRSRQDIHPVNVPEKPSDRVPGKKRISSDKKVVSGVKVVDTPAKGEETPLPEKSVSTKCKRGEKLGSITAEKNVIRKQIIDMLLGAGWTVEHRPRQGREYKDAVYVNPEGKTHWSVTKAYGALKCEVEGGKVGSSFCFTPIPEEVLGKLFRVVCKTRCDKNKKKKHKRDGDDYPSDEDKPKSDKLSKRGKGGAKHKHSAMKRKPSVRDGTQSRRRCALLVRGSNQRLNSENDVSISHSGKHSILAWMIDSGVIPLDGKVHYMSSRRTKATLEGCVTRDGIRCCCCKEIISLTQFENHAGSKTSQPYENLFLESGHSLLQCLLDSWNRQEEAGLSGFHSVEIDGDDPNDDTCGICGDGGDLICCDGCPSTFHQDCLDVEEFPSGEWHCVYCVCKFCGAVAASQSDYDCCTDSSSLVTCSLCNEKYHQSCIIDEDAVCMESKQPTFCGRTCEQIFERLRSLVGVKCDLGDGFSWTLLQHYDVEADAVTMQPQKIQSNSKLAVALSVMDECFLPIIDPRSGINLIRHIVYSCGSNFNRLNFSSFFTIILERGDEVISAASVRVHGKQLAEMPFIGTRHVYRRQGMCRRLLRAIELVLGSIDVEKLVIPAIPELLHTWTSVFGFNPLEDSLKEEMRSMNMLVFPHTAMLQKPLSKREFVEKIVAVAEDEVKCGESMNEHLVVGFDKPEVDDGCLNGRFDLNSLAPILTESSSDERHLGCPASTAGNYEDEVKSGMDLGRLSHAKRSVSQSPPMVNDGDQVGASALVNSSDGRTLRPDLNLEEAVSEDKVNPDFLESSSNDTSLVHPNSSTVSSDEVAKNGRTSNGPINVEGRSTMVNDGDQYVGSTSIKNSSRERTLNPDLNLTEENVSEYNGLPFNSLSSFDGKPVACEILGDDNVTKVSDSCNLQKSPGGGETMQSGSLTCCQGTKVERANIDMSDAHDAGPVALSMNREDVTVEVKFGSRCEFHETKEVAVVETVASTNISLCTGAQFPSKSTEVFQSHSQVEYTSVTPITSESSCNVSSGAGETCITGFSHGIGVPKV